MGANLGSPTGWAVLWSPGPLIVPDAESNMHEGPRASVLGPSSDTESTVCRVAVLLDRELSAVFAPALLSQATLDVTQCRDVDQLVSLLSSGRVDAVVVDPHIDALSAWASHIFEQVVEASALQKNHVSMIFLCSERAGSTSLLARKAAGVGARLVLAEKLQAAHLPSIVFGDFVAKRAEPSAASVS